MAMTERVFEPAGKLPSVQTPFLDVRNRIIEESDVNTRGSVRGDLCNSPSPTRMTERRSVIDDEQPSDEVTVVTAFFDIGPFLKMAVGNMRLMRNPKDYFKWSDIFGRMDNPLIAYTDNVDFYHQLKSLRNRFNSTRSKIYLIQKSDLWAFSLLHTVTSIYNQTGYPKIAPATVSPDYTCVTHAKMELLQRVMHERPFNTRFYSWVDIGVFREFSDINEVFHVSVPPELNSSRILFNKVSHFDKSMEISKLIRYCYFWLGAGVFMGEVKPLTMFLDDYMKMVRMLITRYMIGAEEQVFYAMYRNFLGFKPRVDIQLFDRRYDTSINFWFALAGHFRKLGYYTNRLNTTAERVHL